MFYTFMNYLGLEVVPKAANATNLGKGHSCSFPKSVLRSLGKWGNDGAVNTELWWAGP